MKRSFRKVNALKPGSETSKHYLSQTLSLSRGLGAYGVFFPTQDIIKCWNIQQSNMSS